MNSHVLHAFTVCYSVVYKRDAVKHNAFTDLSPFTEGGENRLFYTSFPPALATGYIYLKSTVLTA